MKKILWIVNSALGPVGEKLYGRREQGVWMDVLLDGFKHSKVFSIFVVTTGYTKEIMELKEEGVVYYVLPSTPPNIYDENRNENIKAWKWLIDEVKPDLIQIWGSEFAHGLCALRYAGKIPSIVYMQGYMRAIAKYYLAGLTEREIVKNITFRDLVKRDSIIQQQKKYEKAAKREEEILKLSGRIISENEWCALNAKAIIPEIKIFKCPLSINKVFASHVWNLNGIEKHSIICTASGYPLKGLHMVISAVALLKKYYNDVKLYIPGPKVVSESTLEWKIRKRGYTKYIEQLIRKLGVESNVVWLGEMQQEDLACLYTKMNVFVLCSAIENHSSSLKEAMMVGVPSIASYVGGVPEYVNDGLEALLYRYEEYEILSETIKRVFEDDELACSLSANGRNKMLKMHNGEDIQNIMTGIYNKLL